MRSLFVLSCLLAGCISSPPSSDGSDAATPLDDVSYDSADAGSGDAGGMPDGGVDAASDAGLDVSLDVGDVSDTAEATDADAADGFDADGDAAMPRQRIPITIQGGTVGETLTNFPLLLDIENADLAALGLERRFIAFGRANGEPLSYEIQAYNQRSGRLRAWVSLPAVEADADTTFYLMFEERAGNSAAVWSDYAGVWHLQRENNMGMFLDRSPSNNHAVSVGTPSTSAGQIGNALELDGSTQWLEVADDDTLEPQQLTISLWANLADNGRLVTLFSKPYGSSYWNSYQIYVDEGFGVWSWLALDDTPNTYGTHSISPGTWVYLAYTWDGSTMTQYVDGQTHSVAGSGAVSYDGGDVFIGADIDDGQVIGKVQGLLDEVRIATTVFSEARIEAERLNQSDPSAFYAVSPIETY